MGYNIVANPKNPQSTTFPSQTHSLKIANDLILSVFRALHNSNIQYCLLRGLEELAAPVEMKQEIDLLVKSKDLSQFTKTIAEYGFIQIPSWGYAPHHFFVAFDKMNDVWIKLDVVTDLFYGNPIRFIKLDLAEHCLITRIKIGTVYYISPENEFITLLLHCILDKGKISPKHSIRLKLLYATVSKNPTIIAEIEKYLLLYFPATFTWTAISTAIEREDWQWFIDQQRSIERKLFRQHPIRNSSHKYFTISLRKLRPFLFVLCRHGVSVALLAPDGAGKSTLAEGLLKVDYLHARFIYMGTNTDSSNIGFPTTKWIKRHRKSLEGEKSSPKLKIFKVLHFSNRLLEQWFRYGVGLYHKSLGRCIIFDRYVYDSYLAPPEKKLGIRIRRWLLKHTCPSPDLVLFLDAPGKVLYERKREHSPERLEQQRQIFLGLEDKISNMVIIDATCNANEVRNKATVAIWQCYGKKVPGKQLNGREN